MIDKVTLVRCVAPLVALGTLAFGSASIRAAESGVRVAAMVSRPNRQFTLARMQATNSAVYSNTSLVPATPETLGGPGAPTMRHVLPIDSTWGQVSGENVNVRMGPGTKNKIITTLHGGEYVKVKSSQGSWLEIEWPQSAINVKKVSGAKGALNKAYIFAKYVVVGVQPPPARVPVPIKVIPIHDTVQSSESIVAKGSTRGRQTADKMSAPPPISQHELNNQSGRTTSPPIASEPEPLAIVGKTNEDLVASIEEMRKKLKDSFTPSAQFASLSPEAASATPIEDEKSPSFNQDTIHTALSEIKPTTNNETTRETAILSAESEAQLQGTPEPSSVPSASNALSAPTEHIQLSGVKDSKPESSFFVRPESNQGLPGSFSEKSVSIDNNTQDLHPAEVTSIESMGRSGTFVEPGIPEMTDEIAKFQPEALQQTEVSSDRDRIAPVCHLIEPVLLDDLPEFPTFRESVSETVVKVRSKFVVPCQEPSRPGRRAEMADILDSEPDALPRVTEPRRPVQAQPFSGLPIPSGAAPSSFRLEPYPSTQVRNASGRLISAEGILQNATLSPVQGASYALVRDGITLYFIVPRGSLDIESMLGRQVTVTGVPLQSASPNSSVLEIQSIAAQDY